MGEKGWIWFRMISANFPEEIRMNNSSDRKSRKKEIWYSGDLSTKSLKLEGDWYECTARSWEWLK